MSQRLRVRADWYCRCCSRSAPGCGRSRCRHTQSTSRRCWRTFPDVRIVWAHRDPFKSTASFLRLNYLSRAVLGAVGRRPMHRAERVAPA